MMKLAKILVAEDDPDDRLLMKDAFSELDFTEIDFFNNGKLLVDHIFKYLNEEDIPQLILVDLNMPMLDGRGVIKALRAEEKTSKIPLVVLSTSKEEKDRRTALELGADDFFSKPASFGALVEILSGIRNRWISNGKD